MRLPRLQEAQPRSGGSATAPNGACSGTTIRHYTHTPLRGGCLRIRRGNLIFYLYPVILNSFQDLLFYLFFVFILSFRSFPWPVLCQVLFQHLIFCIIFSSPSCNPFPGCFLPGLVSESRSPLRGVFRPRGNLIIFSSPLRNLFLAFDKWHVFPQVFIHFLLSLI